MILAEPETVVRKSTPFELNTVVYEPITETDETRGQILPAVHKEHAVAPDKLKKPALQMIGDAMPVKGQIAPDAQSWAAVRLFLEQKNPTGQVIAELSPERGQNIPVLHALHALEPEREKKP